MHFMMVARHHPPSPGRRVAPIFFSLLLLLGWAAPRAGAQTGLPVGWQDQDIGGPANPGSAGYTNGAWTLTGGGSDIWNNADQFNFTAESWTGDGTLMVRVLSLGATDPWAKAGLMFRNDTTAGAVNVAIVATPGNGVSFQWRTTANGGCGYSAIGGLTAPVWLRLSRTQSVFTAYYSLDGKNWSQVGTPQTLAIGSTALAGLAVTAHNNGLLTTGVFTNLTTPNFPLLGTFGVYRELWTNLNASVGNSLAALTNTSYNPNWPANPAAAFSQYLGTFETATNTGMTNYGQRLRTFIVPPTNGAYTFWIASDNSSDLFLSPDEYAVHKTLIAAVPTYTGPRQWNATTNQQSAPLNLQGGRRYYLEAIMQHTTNNDNLAVQWQLPGGAYETPLTAVGAPGTLLVPNQGADTPVGIYTFPTNFTANSGSNATFTLVVTNQTPVAYQWWTNGARLATPAGTNSVLVVTNLSVAANNGQLYQCVATNSTGAVTSAPVTLTVLATLPAAVTNLPATGVQAVSATLNGQVLTPGTIPPAITIYYGPNNGGTTPAAWSNSVPLGVQSGAFAMPVFGLATNTTYYFTAVSSNAYGMVWAAPSLSFTTLATPSLVALSTLHYDNSRAGANTNETILTPANVNTNTFGRLFGYNVDGYVFAAPLVATNVNVPGRGVHNLMYIVTEHDTVYAFDADNYVPVPYWTNSFLNAAAGITAVPGGDAGGNVQPEVGITATPVIDPATATMYVEARTKEIVGGVATYPHRLHALDLATGFERTNFNSPVLIAVTNYPGTGTPGYNDTDGNGHVLWNGQREHSRPALLLANGMVYFACASPGDISPYYGWVFAYDAHNLSQRGVFNSAPNSGLSGVWMTGNGIAADTTGNIYFMTGNGNFDSNGDYGDSYLKMSTTNGLQLVDYFTPYNQASLNAQDLDVASAGLLLLPDSAGSAAHPHLLLGGTKANTLYLLDRDNLGHYNATADTQVVQALPNAVGGMWSAPSYWNGLFYVIGNGDVLKCFTLTNATMGTVPVSQSSQTYGYPGATPVISANGRANAIVWAVESDAYGSGGPAVLHAYNATNVAQELYHSSQLLSRDNPAPAVEFTQPSVVNGKVYVAGQYAVSVFGNGAFLATPTITPNGGVFTNSVTVTLADTSPGTVLYYTLDGTLPTTNSTAYAGPLVVSNSLGLHVVAVRAGAVDSGVAVASFVNSSSIGSGTGLQGNYYSNQLRTFNGAPTLVRTDATVNFNWGTSAPDPKISQTDFSVRWLGAVQPQFNETYTFSATADDGVRVWINGQKILDGWVDQAPATYTGTFPMVAQQRYNIQVDYYQNGGGAVAMLAWSSPSTASAIVPASQLYPVTNPPPGVVLTGPANGASFTAGGAVTLAATAAAQYNTLAGVAFYANGLPLGTATNSPYGLTATNLAAGAYTLTAVVTDATGVSGTSAPVAITLTAPSGLPYGVAARPAAPAFFNLPTAISGNLPATLSQTGVFTNTPAMAPAAALLPYQPNTALWSDAAVKTRWLAVPYTGGVITPNQQIGYAPTGEWTFPTGTIFVKHFNLITDETDSAAPLRRLETRLLVRGPNGAVYGVTYKWRPDNSDADLLTASLTENLTITNATGVRTQTWYYPSPTDCLTCHNAAASYVLGLKTRQLNGNLTYPATGVTDNQLRTLNHLGLLNPAIDEAGIGALTQMVSVSNPAASLGDRARSYLDANCAQCHRPGGSGGTFDARFDTPLTNQNLIYGSVVRGNLGVDRAAVVVPDDIWRSILYQRAATVAAGVAMPPLAKSLVDTNAMAVLAAWINSLPGVPALPPPTITPAGGSFYGGVSVALQAPPVAGANLYYTLDGSLPTNGSALYGGPVTLTNSATLTANAFAAGYTNSVAVTAAFTILPGVWIGGGAGFVNQSFQVPVSGLPGGTYVLQSSTDLATWTAVSTNVPAASPFTLTDPTATNGGYRFYRAVRLP